MKSRIKNIIILFVISLSLIAILIFQNKLNSKKNNTDNAKESITRSNFTELLSVDKNKLSSIIIKNNNNSFEFVRVPEYDEASKSVSMGTESSSFETNSLKISNTYDSSLENKKNKFNNSEYNIASPLIEDVSKIKIKSIIDSITNIKYTNKFDDNANLNLNNFGLSDTNTFVQYIGEDINLKLYIGNKVPSIQGEYYAKIDGEDRVYTIKLADTAFFFKDVDLLDPSVFNVDFSNIEKFIFTRNLDNLNLEFIKNNDTINTDSQSEENKFIFWSVANPVVHDADSDKINELLSTISSISAEGFVINNPSKEDLQKYSLDNNADFIFTFNDNNKQNKLYIGKSSGDGYYYAYSDQRNYIFKIADKKMTKFGLDKVDLLDKFAMIENINNVKKIAFQIADKEAIFDLDVPSNKDNKLTKEEVEKASIFKINGIDINKKDENQKNYFKEFYKSLISIMVSDIDVSEQPQFNVHPDVHIKYILKNDETKDLKLYRRDSNNYYIVVNDKYTGLISNTELDGEDSINNNFNRILEMTEVKSSNIN